MRSLASIQKIDFLEPIDGADKILKAKILGWTVVVLKDDFRIGDTCVFCEIDSVLPERPEFEFLRDKKFRIKTVRMKGVVSQGIAFPMKILNGLRYLKDTRVNPVYNFKVGDDVTALLGVTKYELPIPAQLAGEVKGNFPPFLVKSDETRIQVLQKQLTKYKGIICSVTEKCDGSSMSCYYYKGMFGVCSRNLELKLNEKNFMDNAFVKMAVELKLEDKLRVLNKNIAIQGELCGLGIGGNRLKLSDRRVYWFSVFDIDSGKYLSVKDTDEIFAKLGLTMVPSVDENFILVDDIDALVKLSTGKSLVNPLCDREGIVIRLIENIVDYEDSVFQAGRVSFKVVSPEYLLKNGE